MCVLSKGHRLAGIQDIPTGGKTIGGEIRLNKKSPEHEKYFRIKVILWLDKAIHEVNPEFINPKFSVTSFISETKSVYHWDESHTKTFEELKRQIVNITENIHFDIKRTSRLKTDASDSGLGSTLEQWDGEKWLIIAFAFQFLNHQEMKYSTMKWNFGEWSGLMSISKLLIWRQVQNCY